MSNTNQFMARFDVPHASSVVLGTGCDPRPPTFERDTTNGAFVLEPPDPLTSRWIPNMQKLVASGRCEQIIVARKIYSKDVVVDCETHDLLVVLHIPYLRYTVGTGRSDQRTPSTKGDVVHSTLVRNLECLFLALEIPEARCAVSAGSSKPLPVRTEPCGRYCVYLKGV